MMNTKQFSNWLKNSSDDIKQRFAINWKIPHTLFNIACKFHNCDDLQDINWFKIYQARDLGNWSHGGKVFTIGGTK